MGGNALKNVETQRLSPAEFRRVVREVSFKLHQAGLTFAPIKAYREKESFGDVDFLVVSEYKNNRRMVDTLLEVFQPVEYVTERAHHSFMSMAYDGVYQLDFVLTKPEEFESAQAFYAWNDLGNFVGRTAANLGFKYGFDGLAYELFDDDRKDQKYAVLTVTRDPLEALEFLGFRLNEYTPGFDTKRDIFEFATSSKYFDPRVFAWDMRDGDGRRRDVKRTMYTDILEFLEWKYPGFAEQEYVRPPREKHLERAFDRFPDFSWAHTEAKCERFLDKLFRSRVNGKVVMRYLAVEQKELGKVMGVVLEHFRDADRYLQVLEASAEDAEGMVVEFLKSQWPDSVNS